MRTVEHAGLAALVSTLEGDELAAAREVRAHWRVLEDASKSATVLPVRFGTVLEGDRAVRERLLEPNAERLTEMLDELAGRVQLNVRGDYDEERLLREVVRTSPQVAALRDRVSRVSESAGYYDRIRLGELVAARDRRSPRAGRRARNGTAGAVRGVGARGGGLLAERRLQAGLPRRERARWTPSARRSDCSARSSASG